MIFIIKGSLGSAATQNTSVTANHAYSPAEHEANIPAHSCLPAMHMVEQNYTALHGIVGLVAQGIPLQRQDLTRRAGAESHSAGK